MGIGQPDAPVRALLYYGDYLYVGGEFGGISGKVTSPYVARYQTVTGTWEALAGATDTVLALAEFSGDVYAATANDVSRWSATDNDWISVGTTPGTIGCMEKSADDSTLYVGGTFTTFDALPNIGGYAVVSYDGGSWSASYVVGVNGPNVICNGLALYNDDLYGAFNKVSSSNTEDYCLQTFNPGTASWTRPLSAPTDGDPDIYALLQVSDNLIYIVGDGAVRSWNGSDTDTGDLIGTQNSALSVPHTAIASYLSDVYVGGQYTQMNSVTGFNRIARYSGGYWTQLGTGCAAGNIRAVEVVNTNVFVGGSFTTAGGKGIPYLAVWITDFQALIDALSSSGSFNMGAAIHSATAITTPTDNDEFPLWEDTTEALRKVTWANIKATLKTYLDTLYGKLATINTWVRQQSIINATNGEGGLYVQTIGDAYTADIEQYTVNNNVTSPALFLYRASSGTGNITSPMVSAWQDSSGTGTITGDWIHFQQSSTDIFSVEVDGSVWSRGFIKPNTHSDSDAPNSSLYFSSSQSKLVWKDSGGVVNNLY
jgi:hypothetical protein